jgi:hypothetical protein
VKFLKQRHELASVEVINESEISELKRAVKLH